MRRRSASSPRTSTSRATSRRPGCSRTARLVSHAGSGTFLAALARRLPQLLLPQAADQFLNAAAGDRAGAGIAIQSQELTPGSVREGLGRVLGDPSFTRAAERLSAEIAAMPDPDAVAAAIEDRFA